MPRVFSSSSAPAQHTHWVKFPVTELCVRAFSLSHVLPHWSKACQTVQVVDQGCSGSLQHLTGPKFKSWRLIITEEKYFGIKVKITIPTLNYLLYLPQIIAGKNCGAQQWRAYWYLTTHANKVQGDSDGQCNCISQYPELTWYSKKIFEFLSSQRIPKFSVGCWYFLCAPNKIESFNKGVSTDIWFTQNCRTFNVPFKRMLGL